MANILAIRLSALGDIAMTVAVLKSFADIYPEHHITLMSRPFAAPLLEGLPENVHFHPVRPDDYKGLGGLRRLSRELIDEGYDHLADMHDMLRSKVIRFFFRRAGLKVAVIDKGRKGRKELTRAKNKVLEQQTTSPQRYADVLSKLGFPIELKPYHLHGEEPADISDLEPVTGRRGDERWIGIAPFAAHEGKIYPLGLMREAVRLVAKESGVRIFLFGSGDKEREWCESFEEDNIVSMVGKSNLQKELRLMTNLNVIVTMDSANMHLGALAGCPTLSIWGATHPLAGFAGMQTADSRILQKDMNCRPCSIFGNKPCIYGDYRCMTGIRPAEVADAIKTFL